MFLNIELLKFELEEFKNYQESNLSLEKYFQNYNKNDNYKNSINKEYIYEICHITNTKLFKYDKNKNQIILSQYADSNSNENIKNQKYKDYNEYLKAKINKNNKNFQNFSNNEIRDFISFKQKRMEETIFYLKKDYNNDLKNNSTTNLNKSSNNNPNITNEEKEQIEKDFYFQHFRGTEEENKLKFDEINSYDKRKVYIINGEQFKSKYEAKIYQNYILPLQLKYGITIKLQERYDKLVETKSQHTMDFLIEELNLLIEATNYTKNWKIGLINKGSEYGLNVKYKKNIVNTNNSIRNEHIKLEYLLLTPNGNKDFDLPYNINENEFINILEQKLQLIRENRILNHPSYVLEPTEEVKNRLERNFNKQVMQTINDIKNNKNKEISNDSQEETNTEKTKNSVLESQRKNKSTLSKYLNLEKHEHIQLFKKIFNLYNKDNIFDNLDEKNKEKINTLMSNFDFSKIKEEITILNEELILFLKSIDKNDNESKERLSLKIKHNNRNMELIINYESFMKNILSISTFQLELDKDRKFKEILNKTQENMLLSNKNITIFLMDILNLKEIFPLIYGKKVDMELKTKNLINNFKNDLKNKILLLMSLSKKSLSNINSEFNFNEYKINSMDKAKREEYENNFSFDFY